MARDDYEDDDYEDDDLLEDEYGDEEEDEDRGAVSPMAAGIGAWGVSLALHGLALGLVALIVFTRMIPEKAPIRTQPIPPPAEQPEEKKERDIIEQVQTEITSDEVSENPQVTELDVPVEEIETEDEEVSENPAKGREEAVSSSEMGGAAAFMAMGAGGGAAGAFGNRNGGGRRRAVGRFGGSKSSERELRPAWSQV
ncbi:MAG: hypothetical protein ACYTF0_05170 [Planctomycetota bacterium]|jgi:hypothetical protein